MKVQALGFTGFRVLAQAINTAMKKANTSTRNDGDGDILRQDCLD